MRQSLDARIPKGLPPKRLALLALALGEVGTRETTGRNDGPVEKYMPAAERGKGYPYCCWFVGWAWHQFFGVHPYGSHIGRVASLYAAAQKRNEAISGLALAPRLCPGDAFIILHGGGTGHAGLVLRVSEDGSMFNTVEGNYGNKVGIATRASVDLAGAVNPYGRLAGEHDPVGFERGLITAPFAGNSVAGTR